MWETIKIVLIIIIANLLAAVGFSLMVSALLEIFIGEMKRLRLKND